MVAVLDDMAAAAFAPVLGKLVRRWTSPAFGLMPEDAAVLKAGYAELVRARDVWLASRGFPSAGRPAEMAAVSTADMEITTLKAGELLNLTPSRVRQLCRAGLLSGRKVDGRWMVRRSAVVAYPMASRRTAA
jgi:hypothetical protein